MARKSPSTAPSQARLRAEDARVAADAAEARAVAALSEALAAQQAADLLARSPEPDSSATIFSSKAEPEDHPISEREAGSPEAPPPDSYPAVLPNRWMRWSVYLIVLVIISACIATLLMDARHHTVEQQTADTAAVLRTARTGVSHLISVNTQDVDGYVQQVLDDSTAGWHDEFDQRKEDVIAVLSQSQSGAAGQVTEAGIEEILDDGSTSVLVSAETQSQDTNESQASNAPDQNRNSLRFRVRVVEVDGQLKLSKVEFVQ